MINNFNLIKPLLDFNSEDDFYFLQILQRKKDHPKGKVNGTNNNSRLIKAYYVKSLEHFEFIKPEVIALCDLFHARAGINLNKRSFKRTQLLTIRHILDQSINGAYNKVHRAYNTMCGVRTNDNKIWIVDVDEKYNESNCEQYIEWINECKPKGNKIITILPSKSGYHIITKPFNLKEYSDKLSLSHEIHRNNPTNLYIP